MAIPMNHTDEPRTLLIDIGNSRIKLGAIVTAGRQRDASQRDATVLNLAHGELDTMPQRVRELGWRIDRAVGVNVAGSALELAVQRHVQAIAATPVSWTRSQARHGELRNGYDNPEQLGADRWVALIGLAMHSAAAASAPTPALLASFGTATTIDTLGPDLVFHGGLILPGPDLMMTSLANNTANLPNASGAAADYPRHTHQAIATGMAAAQVGAVLRQWRIGLEKFGAPVHVYVTGGAWPSVDAELRLRLAMAQKDLGLPTQDVLFLPSPVLDGLASLAMRDQSR